jgi:hypothetical protein
MTERGEAGRIGAKLQKNSGRGRIQKGDARWHGFIVDFKEFSKSFSLSRAVWAKASTDAVRQGADPMIIVVLGEEGEPKTRLAVVELALLEQILEAKQANET